MGWWLARLPSTVPAQDKARSLVPYHSDVHENLIQYFFDSNLLHHTAWNRNEWTITCDILIKFFLPTHQQTFGQGGWWCEQALNYLKYTVIQKSSCNWWTIWQEWKMLWNSLFFSNNYINVMFSGLLLRCVSCLFANITIFFLTTTLAVYISSFSLMDVADLILISIHGRSYRASSSINSLKKMA